MGWWWVADSLRCINEFAPASPERKSAGMVAARIANMRQGARTDLKPSANLQEVSLEDAAEMANISCRSAAYARKILESGVSALVALVDTGKVTVSVAAEAAEMPEDRQQIFASEVEAGKKPKEALRRVRRSNHKEVALPTGKYRVIYADPPWRYSDSGVINDDNYGRAERHYDTLSVAELCAMGEAVTELAESDAVLFLWATSPMLEDALKVVSAWGFKYKASFVWDKVRHNFGHYNSVRHEFLLICTRGSCLPDSDKKLDSVITQERTNKHSEKPEVFRDVIDQLYTQGRRIELFARIRAEGWDGWGMEYQ